MNLRLSVLAFAAALFALPALAQQPPGVMESLPQLVQEPASHTGFSFDRSELQAAQQFLDNGLDGKTAALNGIAFDNFHFARPAFYDPEVLQAIEDRYHAAGWKHLVNANAQPGNNQATDLWLHFHGGEIDDVTVLVRGQREMNMIQISCMLRPLDLIHLSGHFGIPKVDPNAVMVPDGRR